MNSDAPCPRCGSFLLQDGPTFGSDSYDSYSFGADQCANCGLLTGFPWSDDWYVDVWDYDNHTPYDPSNPDHQEIEPWFPAGQVVADLPENFSR